MNKLQKAQAYINENRNKVNPEFRLGYHVMGEVGWINDPNGFCFYKGEYHLFYQYHPYDSVWGPMHWGHAKSKDLVKWEQLPVAIAPDMYYDVDGCFSGSAIERQGKLYLMYTGNTYPDSGKLENGRQIQNIAVSEDGIEFEKVLQNPVISTRDLPGHALPQDFRDPKVFQQGDSYYVVLASRNIDRSGQILLYKSKELLNWSYVGTLCHSENKLGEMWECPDLFKLGNKDVLIMSPQFLEQEDYRYQNLHSSVYMLGDLDFETGKYDYYDVQELDYGFDFYAPQTLVDEKGRRIMIAWMQMWERKMPTHLKGHNWAGAMTLPRELKIIDGKLYQYPIEEIKNYRSNHISYNNVRVGNALTLEGIEGQNLELDLEIDLTKADTFGIRLMKGMDEEVTVLCDKAEGLITFDRSKNGEDLSGASVEVNNIRKAPVSLKDGKLHLTIFLDRISVEVFIQLGTSTITSTVYPKVTSKGIEFFADGDCIITKLDKWDLI